MADGDISSLLPSGAMAGCGWAFRPFQFSRFPRQKPCFGNNVRYYLLMLSMNLTVAEEALSLSPEDRAALARLLIQSLETDSRTDAQIKAELNNRLEEMLSK